MNLLAGTKDLVTVYASGEGLDEFGATVLVPGDPGGIGTNIYCTVMRPSGSTFTGGGYDTSEDRVLYARSFPFRARTVVLYDGELWDIVDEPETRGYSVKTTFTRARLVKR